MPHTKRGNTFLGRAACSVGLHRYCPHKSTEITDTGAFCVHCEMPMEYHREISGWLPKFDEQFCLRNCGYYRL